jgi:hypothetical protein
MAEFSNDGAEGESVHLVLSAVDRLDRLVRGTR